MTGESFDEVYWADGRPVVEAVARIDWLLRDHNNGKHRRIDLELLHRLWGMQEKLDTDQPFEILSGFRTRETNQKLIERGIKASANSLHMQGMAVDLRVPNRRPRALYRLALSLGGGGTGCYPRRGFVHLDSGPTRRWMGA
jgi:uncharacterized protein YcbK (DUF882 family)